MIKWLALVALTFAAPALAQTAPNDTMQAQAAAGGGAVTPVGAPKPAQVTDQNKKVVCKYTQETGTRLMGHRVCLTQADWAARDEQTREAMDRAEQGLVSPH